MFKITSLLSLLSVGLIFGQDMPLDFENGQDTFTPFGTGCTFSLETDPTNASNTVGAIQNAGNDIYEGVYLDLTPAINFDNSKLVTFDFYSNIGSSTSVQIKFEGSDSGFGDAFVEVSVPGNGWSEVQVDFSQANIIGSSGTQSISGHFSRIAIFVAPGQSLAGTFYIDNINGGNDDSLTFDNLIWSDEFDYTGPPDPTKWHHQVIPIINGVDWANGELQHYTDANTNSFVSNGTLKIKAIKEDYTFNGVTKNYTSARLNSKFAFQYGRIDVHAKLPNEAGTWPAIWTLGANINEIGNYFGNTYGSVGWPDCGEIDIMEQNGWDKSISYGYMHYRNSVSGQYENQGTTTPINDSSGTYHTYSLIWTEDVIQILLDNNVFFERQNNNVIPYDNPHYILLNIAMGGALGLLPDTEIPESFNDATMEIDYVRVYEQTGLGVSSAQITEASMYPNPARDTVVVALNSTEHIQELSLYDITGKLVLHKNKIDSNKATMDISNLRSGLYIVAIKTNTTVLKKRLLVQ